MTSARPSETGTPSGPAPEAEPARATKILLALGTLAVLGGIAWGAGVLISDDELSEEPTPGATGSPLTPWRSTEQPQLPGAAAEQAGGNRPVVLFDGPLAIENGLGVDIDRVKQTEPGQPPTQNTASRGSEAGSQDVYWAQNGGLSVNDGDLFIDQGLPSDAAARCATRVSAGRDGYPSLDVFPGDQFCLRTSEGRIAWLRVGEGAGKDDELAVQVTVWETA